MLKEPVSDRLFLKRVRKGGNQLSTDCVIVRLLNFPKAESHKENAAFLFPTLLYFSIAMTTNDIRNQLTCGFSIKLLTMHILCYDITIDNLIAALETDLICQNLVSNPHRINAWR